MNWLWQRLMAEDERRRVESELAELFEARRARDGDVVARRRRASDRRAVMGRLLWARAISWSQQPRDMRPASSAAGLWRDLRHSGRSLLRSPGLAATIVLTVGLGLGATSAMIAVVQAVLLNPLPYPQADRLFTVRTQNGDNRFPLSVVDYQALIAQQTSFDLVAASQFPTSVTVVVNQTAERQPARIVTSSFLSLLGVTPAAGRLIDRSDEHTGGRAIVLSDAFWRHAFGADPTVVGRTVLIDGAPKTVVGVLSPSDGPLEHDVALFQIEDWPTPTRKGPFFLFVIGRLKAGVPASVAASELAAIDRRLFPVWQSSYQDQKATWALTDLKTRVLGTADTPLWLALAGIAGVWLIACANAANLLVARSLERRRELVVRAALGASRGQLARVLVAESALLTGAAVAVAGLVAAGTVALVTTYGGAYVPRIAELHVVRLAAAWLVGLSIASACAMGALPAIAGSRAGRAPGLGVNRRTMTDGPAGKRVRRLLVAAEFALATPLAIAATLVALSLHRLLHVDIGLDGSHVLTAAVSLPQTPYAAPGASRAFWERLRAGLVTVPGVVEVAFADSRPPADASDINNFDLETRPTPAGENQPLCPWIAISPDFFRATGLTVLRGRAVDARDLVADAPPVIVVDQAWAHRFFGTDDVLGQRLHNGGCTSCAWTTVVGVVSTVKYLGLDKPDEGTVYTPVPDDLRNRYIVLRSSGDPTGFASTIGGVVRGIDPNLAVSRVATIDELAGASTEMPRYLAALAAGFAAAALALSVIGIYGVMAHHVTQHRRDIGIRLALGGEPGRIRRMVVVGGLRIVVAGLIAGVVLAAGAMRFVSSLLFDTPTGDLATFAAIPTAMLAAAACACLLPARRAARVEPAVTLKDA